LKGVELMGGLAGFTRGRALCRGERSFLRLGDYELKFRETCFEKPGSQIGAHPPGSIGLSA